MSIVNGKYQFLFPSSNRSLLFSDIACWRVRHEEVTVRSKILRGHKAFVVIDVSANIPIVPLSLDVHKVSGRGWQLEQAAMMDRCVHLDSSSFIQCTILTI